MAALVERAYAPWVPVIGQRPAPMDDDYARHIMAGEVWVCDRDRSIAALCVLIEAADHLLLDNVAVDPALKGCGLGRAMILHAAAVAMARGHPELRLFTNELMADNISLYRYLGFVETHRATVGPHRRVFMTKRLTPDPCGSARGEVPTGGRDADQARAAGKRHLTQIKDHRPGECASSRHGHLNDHRKI